MENCLLYNAIHDFLVWPRAGSNSISKSILVNNSNHTAFLATGLRDF